MTTPTVREVKPLACPTDRGGGRRCQCHSPHGGPSACPDRRTHRGPFPPLPSETGAAPAPRSPFPALAAVATPQAPFTACPISWGDTDAGVGAASVCAALAPGCRAPQHLGACPRHSACSVNSCGTDEGTNPGPCRGQAGDAPGPPTAHLPAAGGALPRVPSGFGGSRPRPAPSSTALSSLGVCFRLAEDLRMT